MTANTDYDQPAAVLMAYLPDRALFALISDPAILLEISTDVEPWHDLLADTLSRDHSVTLRQLRLLAGVHHLEDWLMELPPTEAVVSLNAIQIRLVTSAPPLIVALCTTVLALGRLRRHAVITAAERLTAVAASVLGGAL